MKKLWLLVTASAGALFLGGCVYEEQYGVAVEGGYRPDYYGGSVGDAGYDDGPYYFYEGRRYYSVDGRYRYYEGGRPIYATILPSGARYITPQQRYRNEVAVNRYKLQQNQYRYATRQQEWQNQQKINQYRYASKGQQWANQQKINQYQFQQKQQQYQPQVAAGKYQKKKKKDDN